MFESETIMKYTLTLSRWHKVAERLNAGSKERETRALTALTATTVSPWNKEGVEAKAVEIAERAKTDLAVIEAATAAVARIRTALALRNVELGISERLAEADAANRRAKLAREQARAHALLDEVADANREKLELELERELSEIAGLAA